MSNQRREYILTENATVLNINKAFFFQHAEGRGDEQDKSVCVLFISPLL